MTGAPWYVAHPLTGDLPGNLARAYRWLAWLQRSEPRAVFALAWAPTAELVVRGLAPDTHEVSRRALADDLAMVESFRRVVLVGGTVSPGMAEEIQACEGVDGIVADLTHLGAEPPEAEARDVLALGVRRRATSTGHDAASGLGYEEHMATEASILRWFDGHPRAPFRRLARDIVARHARSPERTIALRKLLEACDAAIRSAEES